MRRAVQRRQDPRLPARLHRRGSGRGRRPGNTGAGGRRPGHLPGTRPCPAARGSRRGDPRRDVRPRRGLLPGPRRLHASLRRRHALLRRQRDRRRRAAARRRHGARGQDERPLPRHRVLLRRRRRRGRRIPREPQPRRALAAARAVLLRKQPVRDGNRAGPLGIPDGHGAQGRRLRNRGVGRGRHGRPRRRGRRPPRRRGCARRRRTALPGAAHVPVPGALDVRPGTVPRQSRGGPWLERDPINLLRATMEAAGQLSAQEWDQLQAEADAEVTAAVEFAEAGTLEPRGGPDPLRLQRAAPAEGSGHEIQLPRGAPGRDPRRDDPGRAGLPDGRGRRGLRRVLRREPGPAGGVRPGTHPRHSAVRVRFRRRRHRRGPGRDASHRGDHDRQFQPAGPGPDREQRGEPAAHVRRAVQCAAS